MRREYDFEGGERGKYAGRMAAGSVVVVLAPDVAKAFKTSRAANAALRAHLRRLAAAQPRPRRHRARSVRRSSRGRGE